jgi:hypothetical protein
MKQFKTILVSAALLLGVAAPLAVVSGASAQLPDTDSTSTIVGGLDQGSAATDPEAAGTLEDSETRISNIITTVINIFSIVVGVVSVIFIIIGGLKYITSAGDTGNVTSAKNTILYAVIGLVVVLFAQIIVRFVLNRAGPTA